MIRVVNKIKDLYLRLTLSPRDYYAYHLKRIRKINYLRTKMMEAFVEGASKLFKVIDTTDYTQFMNQFPEDPNNKQEYKWNIMSPGNLTKGDRSLKITIIDDKKKENKEES